MAYQADGMKRSKRHRRGPFSYYNVLSPEDPDPRTANAVKKEFGRRLAKAMDDRGWNQSELARRATEWLPKPTKGQKQGATIGRDAISNYIRGDHLPRPSYLRALARALEVTEESLLSSTVPTVSASAPEWSFTAAGPGRVRIKIDTEVSMKVFREITQILAQDKS